MTCFAPSPPPYELKVCCLWGLEEAGMREAWNVKEGVSMAFSKRPVPLRYLQAVCDTAEEASRRAFVINRARNEAAAGFK